MEFNGFLIPFGVFGLFGVLQQNEHHCGSKTTSSGDILQSFANSGQMKEPVGADFIDAKDGLTLIAIEEGGNHRCSVYLVSCCFSVRL